MSAVESTVGIKAIRNHGGVYIQWDNMEPSEKMKLTGGTVAVWNRDTEVCFNHDVVQ